jgi:hypothetical protein
MRQELYATLRERIVKIVPEIEIPKLRDGYKCLVSRNGERYVTSYDVALHDESLEMLQTVDRDIQLADILRVFCHFATPELNVDVGGTPSENLSYAMLSYKEGKKEKSAMWMLAKPLYEQSDELGEWLLTVIE